MNQFSTQALSSRFLTLAAGVFLASVAMVHCAPASSVDEGGDEGGDVESVDGLSDAFSSGSVAQAEANSCTTASVKGLSLQIIAEGNCIEPGAFAPVPARPNLKVGSGVFLFLEKPASDRLVKALDASPSTTMNVNSMLRTVAQQYLLYRWYQTDRCGISLAATPGDSNHETGLALDIEEYGTWRSRLEAQGFAWLGSSDPWHFDYAGAGAVSHKGLDVLAFQRLWNRNNPSDKIAEDGDWGPSTAARMAKAPAAGFSVGAQCGGDQSCKATFVDTCGSPHQEDIDWLATKGVAIACDPAQKLYCPNTPITRAEMAAFLAKALNLPSGPNAFNDDNGSPHEAAINAIAKAGITAGCDAVKKLFCPNEPVTRAQMASFLAKAFNLPSGPNAFNDDNGSPHESAINAIAKAGVTSGCDAVKKLYCPTQNVSRAQMATFLRRAMKP